MHIYIKKLARIVKAGHRITGHSRDQTRGAGWECLYFAVDDESRLAFSAMYSNERAVSSVDFLRRAIEWYLRFDIQVRGVLTDNGPCFYPCGSAEPYHAWHPPPSYPALSPANQRQGRALHPDCSPGMGLRAMTRKLRPAD